MEEEVVQDNKVSVASDWVPPQFGSKQWADLLLKIGIASIRDVKRVPESRLQEFIYQARLLEDYGWTWHAWILRSWAHRYWWNLRPLGVLRPERPTPKVGLGGVS